MYLMPYDSDLSFFSDFRSPFEKIFKSLDSQSDYKNFMSTDIIEKDGCYELIADLPGFKKEDLKIELEKGYLKISATSDKETEEKNNDGTYIRRERRSGSYARTFFVGENVKEEDIKAKFENGILTLNFPKEAKEQETKKFINIEG